MGKKDLLKILIFKFEFEISFIKYKRKYGYEVLGVKV